MKNLNGWQRLWLVVSVGYALFISYAAYNSAVELKRPRLEDILREVDIVFFVAADMERNKKEGISVEPPNLDFPKNMSEENILKILVLDCNKLKNSIAKTELLNMINNYPHEVKKWRDAIKNKIMIGVLRIILVPAVLYLLGLVVLWVKRGFVRHSPS
ncbi:hypothetical protein K9F62_02225 [Desulfovibrio sp. JY]|nr:hypothetical protein K9F62_02225 [Desulfovibrio sp. JY]